MTVRFRQVHTSPCAPQWKMQISIQDYENLPQIFRDAYNRLFRMYPALNCATFGHKKKTKETLFIGWAPFGPDLVLDTVVQIRKSSKKPLLVTPESQILYDPLSQFLSQLEALNQRLSDLELCYDHKTCLITCDGWFLDGTHASGTIRGAINSTKSLVAGIQSFFRSIPDSADLLSSYWERRKAVVYERAQAISSAMDVCDTDFGRRILAREHILAMPYFPARKDAEMRVEESFFMISYNGQPLAKISRDGHVLYDRIDDLLKAQYTIFRTLYTLQKAQRGHQRILQRVPHVLFRYDWEKETCVYAVPLSNGLLGEVRIPAQENFDAQLIKQQATLSHAFYPAPHVAPLATNAILNALDRLHWHALSYVLADYIHTVCCVPRPMVSDILFGQKLPADLAPFQHPTCYDGTIHYASSQQIDMVLDLLIITGMIGCKSGTPGSRVPIGHSTWGGRRALSERDTAPWDLLYANEDTAAFSQAFLEQNPAKSGSYRDTERLVLRNRHATDLHEELALFSKVMRYPFLADWNPEALKRYMGACPPQIQAYIESYRTTIEDPLTRRYYKFLCDAAEEDKNLSIILFN